MQMMKDYNWEYFEHCVGWLYFRKPAAEVHTELGCSLGYHEHHNESETYFILAGQGDYDDNGTVRPVKAGDVTYTPDNHGHALTNTGDIDLVFMALIILD